MFTVCLSLILLDQGISALPIFSLMMVGLALMLHLRPNLDGSSAQEPKSTSATQSLPTPVVPQPLPTADSGSQPNTPVSPQTPIAQVPPATQVPQIAQGPQSAPATSGYRVVCNGYPGLNLRDAPNGKILQLLPCNASGIQVTGNAFDQDGTRWVPVTYQGQQGWAAQAYLAQ